MTGTICYLVPIFGFIQKASANHFFICRSISSYTSMGRFTEFALEDVRGNYQDIILGENI